MDTPITAISPSRQYKVQEVVDLKLIPGLTSYTSLYNLITTKRKQIDNKQYRRGRQLESQTTAKSIRATHVGKAWMKIRGKTYIEGKELILFRRFNNLL